MDPNTALAQFRDLLRQYDAADDSMDRFDLGEDIVTASRELDDWLRGGGCLPEAWPGDPGPHEAIAVHKAETTGQTHDRGHDHTSADETTDEPTDTGTLDAIAAYLSGREWSGEDLDFVAQMVLATGREIAEPEGILDPLWLSRPGRGR